MASIAVNIQESLLHLLSLTGSPHQGKTSHRGPTSFIIYLWAAFDFTEVPIVTELYVVAPLYPPSPRFGMRFSLSVLPASLRQPRRLSCVDKQDGLNPCCRASVDVSPCIFSRPVNLQLTEVLMLMKMPFEKSNFFCLLLGRLLLVLSLFFSRPPNLSLYTLMPVTRVAEHDAVGLFFQIRALQWANPWTLPKSGYPCGSLVRLKYLRPRLFVRY